MRSLALAAVIAVAVVGCSLAPSNWGDRVPTINPQVVANRQAPISSAGTITLTPISERGADVGRPYKYDMPHCGLSGPIDIDGSFWVAVGYQGDPVAFDGTTGTFTLTDRDHARYTADSGAGSVDLARSDSPREFRLCS